MPSGAGTFGDVIFGNPMHGEAVKGPCAITWFSSTVKEKNCRHKRGVQLNISFASSQPTMCIYLALRENKPHPTRKSKPSSASCAWIKKGRGRIFISQCLLLHVQLSTPSIKQFRVRCHVTRVNVEHATTCTSLST